MKRSSNCRGHSTVGTLGELFVCGRVIGVPDDLWMTDDSCSTADSGNATRNHDAIPVTWVRDA
jgi:hypothetical protein